tara:strand:+ start:2020 stop:2211 length:192 start_codon:yes stop_codon:yes gene_type:complete
VKFPSLFELLKKFRLPNKKIWGDALKVNRWPVVWWDEEVEARRKKEELRKKRIKSLYPSNGKK